jgi:hypothetical protein
LEIDFFQQGTHPVCSPLLPERSGEAAYFPSLSMKPELVRGLRFD